MAGAKLIDVTAEGLPRIDRYELVAEIASGGMATVFLARLSGVGGFQRFVAIKRLHPHLASEQEFVQMFLDEARLAAGIHHPNVVPILEVGASERGYYLVMEYIEGDTLARLLARSATAGRSVPTNIALRVVVDMLAGLHAAHELRDVAGNPTELVHRDVSPQNVLVGVDGISRITDFGVARAASRLGGTRAGQLKGKIAYMAPEHAAGENIDRRADVFAAGIVLWEVLAGRRLFKADNEAATISRILNEPIPSPAKYNPELTGRIVAVCMKALARDRDRRFVTAAAFADALERSTTNSPTVRLATIRETAAYVSEAIGAEIAQQRDAVRAWLSRSEASFRRPIVASSLTAAAMAVPGRGEEATASYASRSRSSVIVPGRSNRRFVAAVTGAIVVVGAVGAYLLTRAGDVPAATVSPSGNDLAGRSESGAGDEAASRAATENQGHEASDAGSAASDASLQPDAPSPTVAGQQPGPPPTAAPTTPGTTAPTPLPVGPRFPPQRPRPRHDHVDLSNPYR